MHALPFVILGLVTVGAYAQLFAAAEQKARTAWHNAIAAHRLEDPRVQLAELTRGLPTEKVAAYATELERLYTRWEYFEKLLYGRLGRPEYDPYQLFWGRRRFIAMVLKNRKQGRHFNRRLLLVAGRYKHLAKTYTLIANGFEERKVQFGTFFAKVEADRETYASEVASYESRDRRICEIDNKLLNFERVLVRCMDYFDTSREQTLARSLKGHAGRIRFRILHGSAVSYESHLELWELEEQLKPLVGLTAELTSTLKRIRGMPLALREDVEKIRVLLERLDELNDVNPHRQLKFLRQKDHEIQYFVETELSRHSPSDIMVRFEQYRSQLFGIAKPAVDKGKALGPITGSEIDEALTDFESELSALCAA